MQSVSVVPVGLSKYRDGLYPLEPFTKEDACATIDMIERWQKKIYAEHGIHFIHASDEFYTLAERKLPEKERYDGYIQLENGVGMLRLMATEVADALDKVEGNDEPGFVSLATGRLPYPYMENMLDGSGKNSQTGPSTFIPSGMIFGGAYYGFRSDHCKRPDRPAEG